MSTVRYIKVVARTEGHLGTLKAKGYEAEQQDDVLIIQASKVIEGVIDLSTPEKAKEVLGQVIKDKAVFSYRTQFIFAGESEPRGAYQGALAKLGKVSCLVTKGEEAPKKKKTQLGDIFDIL